MDLRILDMKLRELVDDVDLPMAVQLLQARIKDLAPPRKRQGRAADVGTILARGTAKGGTIRVKARDATKLERAITEKWGTEMQAYTAQEGWAYLEKGRRWHYFIGGKGICGHAAIWSGALVQPEAPPPKTICADCRRAFAQT